MYVQLYISWLRQSIIIYRWRREAKSLQNLKFLLRRFFYFFGKLFAPVGQGINCISPLFHHCYYNVVFNRFITYYYLSSENKFSSAGFFAQLFRCVGKAYCRLTGSLELLPNTSGECDSEDEFPSSTSSARPLLSRSSWGRVGLGWMNRAHAQREIYWTDREASWTRTSFLVTAIRDESFGPVFPFSQRNIYYVSDYRIPWTAETRILARTTHTGSQYRGNTCD